MLCEECLGSILSTDEDHNLYCEKCGVEWKKVDATLKVALRIALSTLFRTREWNDERYLTDEQGEALKKFHEGLDG